MAYTLRQRLRNGKINCLPWKYWKGEIEYLPISAKTLFAAGGISIDILERELKEEGWLFEDEVLLEVLKTDLYREHLSEEYNEDSSFGLPPADFTEEDYAEIGTSFNIF